MQHFQQIFSQYSVFNLTVSIGLVTVDGSLDVQKLLAQADNALYRAKEAGRNKVVYLEPGEDTSDLLSEANRLVALIKGALRENRFCCISSRWSGWETE